MDQSINDQIALISDPKQSELVTKILKRFELLTEDSLDLIIDVLASRRKSLCHSSKKRKTDTFSPDELEKLHSDSLLLPPTSTPIKRKSKNKLLNISDSQISRVNKCLQSSNNFDDDSMGEHNTSVDLLNVNFNQSINSENHHLPASVANQAHMSLLKESSPATQSQISPAQPSLDKNFPPLSSNSTNKRAVQSQANSQNKKRNFKGTTPVAPVPKRIPPFILRESNKWNEISMALKAKNLNFESAKLVKDGISITVSDETNYRKIQEFFLTNSIAFHTYSLPTETTLKVVIRDIPVDISPEAITSSLAEVGIVPIKVIRMTKRKDNFAQPMPMVLVVLTQQFRKIWDLERVCNLNVRVQELQSHRNYIQCHRCQLFGHGQKHCTAPPVCMKCAGGHLSSECPRADAEGFICAHCKEGHASNYAGCKFNPNNNKINKKPPLAKSNKPQNFKPAPLPETNVWQQRQAQAKSSSNSPSTVNSNTNDLKQQIEVTRLIGNLCSNYCSSNPTAKGARQFNQDIAQLFNFIK